MIELYSLSTINKISEGCYEDLLNALINQKVGLDQKQIKQTINKQVLTGATAHATVITRLSFI